MHYILTNTNVVVTARDVNVSIFKPLWLSNCDIFRREELEGDIIITPPLVQIPTKKFELAILPNRIQLLTRSLYAEFNDDVFRIIGGIIKRLPHTPFTAVGLNFNYLMSPDNVEGYHAWNRKLFSSLFSNQIVAKEDKDSRFGCYISYDTLGMRLRSKIKPMKAESTIKMLCDDWEPGQDIMLYDFNFNYNVAETDNPVDSIQQTLAKWPSALDIVEELIKSIKD